MKKLFSIAIVFFTFSLQAQSEIKISSKKCVPNKGQYLRLKEVLNDSRCPESVTCVWAGEVTAVVEVYSNKQFVEEKTLTFNPKNWQENVLWFSKYYQKKVKTIEVVPYPKQGVTIKSKKKYIRIIFED